MRANFQKKLFVLSGVVYRDKKTSIFQTVHFLYHRMELAHNVCFIGQKIFNSKNFESYYKMISRKNIELDFCKYFFNVIYIFSVSITAKAIMKEKQ